MNEKIKRMIYDLLENADLGTISISTLDALLEDFGKTVDKVLLMNSLDWAMKYDNDALCSYMWNVVCVGILGLKGTIDDYYSPNMTFEEYFGFNDSYDYSKDYSEEDFDEITEEEIEDLIEKDEFAKYIDDGVMYQLPPKDLFEKYINNFGTNRIDIDYGEYEITINKSPQGDGYYLDIDGEWYNRNTIDELYNLLENIDSVTNDRYEESHKAEIELEKTKKSIMDRINALNENSTVEDIAKIEASIEFYSDYSKDVNGFRDRGTIGAFYREMKKLAPKAMEEFEKLDWDEKVKLMNY